jgi:hypothetical protein
MTEAQSRSGPVHVALDRIRVDATQSRATLDGATVEEYAAAYQAGEQFPPIILFADGPHFWMGDGFHRYAGAKRAGRSEIEAELRQGTQRDAILYAVGCNDRHGLRRTNADKAHAVRLLLSDPEWRERSDRWVAEACHVSDHFVANVRASMGSGSTAHTRSSDARRGKDGKRRRTKRKTGGGERTKESPALCERCERVGVASCPECKAKGAKARQRKAGQVKFDWQRFDGHLREVLQFPEDLDRAYPGETQGPLYERAVGLLNEFAEIVKEWREKLAKVK